MMPRFSIAAIAIIAVIILVAGCARSPESSDSGNTGGTANDIQRAAATRVIPTLYPTGTAHPTSRPTDTRQPVPASPTETPIAFDQPVVELHYSIPAIGLERTLSGDVSGRLTLTDQLTGIEVERRNQAGIMLEMQQSLPRTSLDEGAGECQRCVWIEYDLPLTGDRDQGWLQDVRMLASIENFMSTILGPHIPPGSVAALRRSATEDQVAHTVALTGDGTVWRWKATDAEIPEPVIVDSDDPILAAGISSATLLELSGQYGADCPEFPGIETLFVTSGNTGRFIELYCPQLALPSTLLPLYLSLDAKSIDILEPTSGTPQEPPLPQETLLFYRSSDGSELTVFYDGRVFARGESGKVITDSITVTLAVSLTASLLESGVMDAGVTSYLESETGTILVVRGPDSLYEKAWEESPDPLILIIVDRLDGIILGLLEAEDEPGEGENAPAPLETPTVTPPAGTTQSPSATPSSP